MKCIIYKYLFIKLFELINSYNILACQEHKKEPAQMERLSPTEDGIYSDRVHMNEF